ncbi:MAG: type II toxin-antitoxin system VapC family toxin [Spirosomaceae bacterium]|jgi:predicted nucleic acid-binding protein|nr:type II toxin-antitoxin system VapC family toxin [Spirosomataceae bacterium]
MIYDTNLIIKHIRTQTSLPSQVIVPIIVVGELKAFALKTDWGFQKWNALNTILTKFPIADLNQEIIDLYAQIDAYSQGKLKLQPLPIGLSSRNMGKNDIWIAATALFFELTLHSTDNDFDHLVGFGLKLSKHKP